MRPMVGILAAGDAIGWIRVDGRVYKCCGTAHGFGRGFATRRRHSTDRTLGLRRSEWVQGASVLWPGRLPDWPEFALRGYTRCPGGERSDGHGAYGPGLRFRNGNCCARCRWPGELSLSRERDCELVGKESGRGSTARRDRHCFFGWCSAQQAMLEKRQREGLRRPSPTSSGKWSRPPKAEYDRLQRVSDEARVKSEQSRLALERHLWRIDVEQDTRSYNFRLTWATARKPN